MTKVVVELNSAGVRELLKSEAMKKELERQAARIATRAGEGYKVKTMGTRVVAFPSTKEAEQDNYNNNTLLKAKGG